MLGTALIPGCSPNQRTENLERGKKESGGKKGKEYMKYFKQKLTANIQNHS